MVESHLFSLTLLLPTDPKTRGQCTIKDTQLSPKYRSCICSALLDHFQRRSAISSTSLSLEITDKKGNTYDLIEDVSSGDKRIIKDMIYKLSIKEITNLISQNNDLPKKEIYNYCLKIKDET